MKLRSPYWCLMAGALLTSSAGCGDDSLGTAHQPRPPGDSDEPPADDLPIQPGTTFWGFFSASTTPSSGGAEVIGELQTSGHVCLKVTGVKQDGTSEALVTTRAKVVGSAASPEIVVNGTVDDGTGVPVSGDADPAAVDAALSPLWLKQLTFPSRDHGYASPVTKDFYTRRAPTPARDFRSLPFFDIRVVEGVWGGWIGDPTSWLARMFGYLIDEVGCTTFSGSDVDCHQSHPTVISCGDYEGLACAQAGCSWDEASGTCSQPFVYQLSLTWRETLSAGADYFQGETVLHTARFSYTLDGVLSSAFELVVPDPDPSAPVTAQSAVAQCRNNLPCLRSEVSFESGWDGAPCTF